MSEIGWIIPVIIVLFLLLRYPWVIVALVILVGIYLLPMLMVFGGIWLGGGLSQP